MAAKRKISVTKVLRALLTLVCVVGCVLAVTSATKFQSRTPLRDIQLRVTNEKAVRFLNATALRELLFTRRHIDPARLTVGHTDVHRLESIARSNPWVQDAQAYIDNGAVLHVTVTQRVPAVRIFEANGASYYLDTALQQLPLSPDYAYDAPVVTGVPTLRNDSASAAFKGQVVSLIRTLAADSFWRNGVEEIAVNPAGEFELVPVLGTHRVLLGDTSGLDAKLHNLFLFYKNVLNRLGWDRYTVLDVRYANQVVASPSLPWKPPVDRALSNINWVKAIVGADTKDESVAPPATGVATPAAATPKPAAVPPVKPAAVTAAAPKAKPAVGPKPAAKTTAAKKAAPSKPSTVPAARVAKIKTPPAAARTPSKAAPAKASKPSGKKPAQTP